MMTLRLRSLIGLAVLVGIAWLLSRNRKAIDWKLVGWGVGLQIAFGAAHTEQTTVISGAAVCCCDCTQRFDHRRA